MIVNPPPGTAASQWLAKEWPLRLGQSIEAMTGEAGQVLPSNSGSVPAIGSWWCQPFSLAPDCLVWVGAPLDSQKLIGRKVLAGAGIDDCSEEDQISSYREILQQALAGLAHGLSGLTGREVTAAGGEDTANEPTHAIVFDIALPGEDPVPILFGWTAETLDRVEQKPPPAQQKPKAAAPASAVAARPPSDVPARTDDTGRPMDLLYDVELPVAVSFGRAHLPLKEVLKLTSGSIIELNRTVNEPVEIIINNCVIARGEVVVVDGNYGVRIQQIISRSERLRTLH